MNSLTDTILQIMDTTQEPEDYMGEDGLLYCGKCHKPKEAYFPLGKALFGRDRHPSECDCRRAERERQEKKDEDEKHNAEVERLKREGFSNPAMRHWTFENDNGTCPQIGKAHSYVEKWETVRSENLGYLLWGNVGSGKSYFAGCIANALMEKEIPVCMTNFATILNSLFYGSENRNEYIVRLCSYPLLILDDFGMERGTEYALEQVYNVIDSRYISKKPLIATTNLTPEQLRNPEDVSHARIYGRLLEMCVPVRFTGGDFRKITAQQKMERLKKLMEGGESQ
jgi:DNA replication protein DnaC